MSHPHTDIIIAVRGTREFPIEKDFTNCIDGLVKHTGSFRLIVVDDNSDGVGAAEVDRVVRSFPTACLVRTFRQNWFTRAYNKGLRMARTPRVVTLNADTVIDTGWLDELYDVWSEAESMVGRVGLVGAVQSVEERRRWGQSLVQNQDYVTGHCWLLSMEAITQVSVNRGTPGIYLDETKQDAIHIRSDVYLCHDLNRAGWGTIKSFKANVGHIGGRSWGFQLGRIGGIRLEDVND